MRILKVAVVFLTRLPVRLDPWHDEQELARASRFFPAVGAVLGLATAALYVLFSALLPVTLAAVLAVASGILLTGALHEDALGDVADGFGGGWDRESVLRILKDPRQGTYGVIAMVLALLLRVGALVELGPERAWAVWPAVAALSRVGMVWMLWRLPSARAEGAAAGASRDLTGRDVAVCTVIGLAVAVGFRELFFPCLAVVVAVTWWWARVARRRLGGVTGDVAGASQQLGELGLWLTLVALG